MMKRFVSSVAAVTLVLGGVALYGVATAGAASAPTITVTPNTGLTGGEKVVITGSGFTAGASLDAVECIATATTVAGCAIGSAVPITANADGTLPSTNFFVQTGTIGNGTCGTSATDATCAIAVGTSTGTVEAHATITFGAAPAGPSLTVSPATGLKNGQSVTVTGTGFTPSDSVYVIECLATATSSAGCNTAGATPVKVNADGTLPSTTFTVVTGTVGTGTCGTTASNSASCAVTVANASGGDAAAAPITFASVTVARSLAVRPATRLKNGQVVKVSGAGFTANDHVYIVECLTGATSSAKCDLKTLKSVTISGAGVLRATTFRVVTGKIGTGTCGTTRSNLNHCAISVANASKGDSKVARITFALPKKK
jgi:hypothetical protein